MALPQLLILLVLVVTLLLFLSGRWRHDVVALIALLSSVGLGLVPPDQAFSGFSHPAVITVACILILSGALQRTGVVDLLAQRLLPTRSGPTVTIGALTALGALLSSFMNNVGALALLMPIALQLAQRQSLPPGKLLMPLSLGTMLGGMTTLIGTPSNLIVSGFRTQGDHHGFSMFDFSPVGVAVAAGGVLFITFVGWRIVPARERAGVDTFNTAAYLTEARIGSDARADGMSLREAQRHLDEIDAQIISMVRNDIRLFTAHPATRLRERDILLIEGDPKTLASAMDSLGLVFSEEEQRPASDSKKENDTALETESGHTETKITSSMTDQEKKEARKDNKKPERTAETNELELFELVILPASNLTGRTARGANIRSRYGVNLLAISRQGSRIRSRVRSTALRQGDVLLVQGPKDLIASFATSAGCAPLAARELRAPDRKKMLIASAIMLLAIGLTTFNVLPAAVSFSVGVLLIMITRVMPLRNVYGEVDWPVIVLLAALLPVAKAMEDTGAARLVATFLFDMIAQGNGMIALVVMMAATMLMTDVINNAATAAIMSPVAVGAANQLDANPDAFLMAVAIGASCAFLTPIGHQNNTLILGPGGFRFSDYWPLGLPLEILVISLSIPMLLIVWPL